MTIKVALAGAGAFGIKHLDGIKNIDGVQVVSHDRPRTGEDTRGRGQKYGIGHVTTDLADSLALAEVDAVILCTPTQMHAGPVHRLPASRRQACAGGDSAGDVLKDVHRPWWPHCKSRAGRVAMCGHTRRFNPSHQYVHKKIQRG